MDIKSLKLAGTFEITPNRIGDSRGYFMETYSRKVFAEHGLQVDWTQENQSLSAKSQTIRGLHFQIPPFAQTKLLRVARGKILDVFVDLRKNSETFGQWDAIRLSEENCKSIYIPQGFAHGFCTLTESVIVQYKVDNFYAPEAERGIRWNDTNLGIDWKVEKPVLSIRDSELPFLKDFVSPF
ncbi:MAG: dTDP-4-dehydrorhamnose 3,5-epimerase [Pyrinomonadaceae bacterium]